MDMKSAYIGIGSNQGDARGNCLITLDRMEEIPGCKVTGLSDFYLTEPQGVKGQEWYVNGVVAMSVGISAQALMKSLLDIEAGMGRMRKERWGPRIIDLDILLFGQEIMKEENIKIPHPRMHERRFVIAPMVDLAPNLVHPSFGKTMAELLQSIPENGQVVKRLGVQ